MSMHCAIDLITYLQNVSPGAKVEIAGFDLTECTLSKDGNDKVIIDPPKTPKKRKYAGAWPTD